MKLSARQIGAVGVARVAGAMEDFSSYDLVAERNGKFHRIQIKTTSKPEHDKLHYRFMTSSGHQGKVMYTKAKVDYIICWAMDEDLFWILKPHECRTTTKKFYPKSGSSWRIINDL
jgi:hypothetical protein